MSLTLFPHQEEGVEWMLRREHCNKCAGGLLMDDCGVGKTPQIIATLMRNPQATTLIVAPVNILKQWQAQLHRWVPDFKVLLYHRASLINALKHETNPAVVREKLYAFARTAPAVHDDESGGGRPLVVITSYGKLTDQKYEQVRRRRKAMGLLERRDRHKTGSTALTRVLWDRVVLDECHLIRNMNTTRTRYILALKARIRWGLTATPIHNGMQDYESLLKFLGLKKWEIAHVFASHPALEKYLTEKSRKQIEGQLLDLDVEHGEVRVVSRDRPHLTHSEITLRRTKNQVFSRKRARDAVSAEPSHSKKIKHPELPELAVDIVLVDFATRAEMDFYRRLEQAVRLEVHQGAGGDAEVEVTEQALFELILRLRQASVNPALVVSGYRRKFRGHFPFNLVPHVVEAPAENMTRLEWRRHCQTRMMNAIGVPSKTRALQRMILTHRREEKAIVFCEFREEMPHLQRDLAAVGVSSVLYDGSLSLAKREDIVRHMSWTNQEIYQVLSEGHFFPGVHHVPWEIVEKIARYLSFDVVIVQINSGNAGLNLQMCSRVYYTNPNWNPCTEIQAWGRAHRLGQTRPVSVVKLALSGHLARVQPRRATHQTESTIDHRVLEVQRAKRAIMSDILDDEEILFNGHLTTGPSGRLTKDDMMTMLGAV